MLSRGQVIERLNSRGYARLFETTSYVFLLRLGVARTRSSSRRMIAWRAGSWRRHEPSD
jgi:hypothetical protein